VPPPLQEPTFLVLAALATEPLYGYAIIQAVAELSDDRVQLRAGTLYPALDWLTADGLIEVAREETGVMPPHPSQRLEE
jgi:DNA-binding PadR family transcriptional regulator